MLSIKTQRDLRNQLSSGINIRRIITIVSDSQKVVCWSTAKPVSVLNNLTYLGFVQASVCFSNLTAGFCFSLMFEKI